MRSTLRLLAVLSVVALCCGQDPSPPNVIILAVDTLRPDHLGCYGYSRDTSPNVDRLAKDGILFESVISQCPWTLPSFATLFTSLYPAQHGAGINMNSLRASFPTLAEVLAENGYATGAVLSSRVLSPDFGVARGFQHYDVKETDEERNAGRVTDLSLGWIDTNPDKPFFLFAHYFDPHQTFSPPAPFDTLFDPGYDGPLGMSFDLKVLMRRGGTLSENLSRLTDADWHYMKALYDGEIAFTDREIGRLLLELERRGLRENTLFVFLSDHGEEFYEHKGLGHGHTLHAEVIRVPLIITMPAVLPKGLRVDEQVRLVDVMPTILDIVGAGPCRTAEGVSLVPSAARQKLKGPKSKDRELDAPVRDVLFPADVAFSEGINRGPERKSVTTHSWKLIYSIPAGEERLYNLKEDPGETENVIAANPDPRASLEGLLFANLFEMSDSWYVEMSPGEQPHVFNLSVSLESDMAPGTMVSNKLFDHAGNYIGDIAMTGKRTRLNVDKLEIGNRTLLAFQAEAPPGLKVKFDITIDGEPAAERTLVGASGRLPGQMPFSLARRAAAIDPGEKHSNASGPIAPDTPYVRIWFRPGQFGRDVRAKIKSETRRELRALGYIQ
jgi:arylsulfatase A-like enzyme